MRVYVYVCLSGYLGIVVLHFQVKSVLNVLVCGSNGCGKPRTGGARAPVVHSVYTDRRLTTYVITSTN